MSTDIDVVVKNKRRMILILLAALLGAALLIFTGYFYQHQRALARERDSLVAIGTVEAKTVMAAFKVPGQITSILVDEGSKVEKGQELAVLDGREIAAKLAQAQGAFEAAQGQTEQAGQAVPLTGETVEASVKQAQALASKAEVGFTNAKQKYERAKLLHEGGAISDSQWDEAINNYEAARSDLEAAQGKLQEALAARQKVQIAQSQYLAAAGQSNQALGAVEEAQAYLDNTILKAPISGYITQKTLEAGEMLNAGTPLFEITDLKHTYVRVFIDESKIGRVKLGQPAEIKIDAFPQRVFRGKVVWINDAGQFAVRKSVNEQYSHDIRSFEVKIDVPNPDMALKTGLTARAKILEKEQ